MANTSQLPAPKDRVRNYIEAITVTALDELRSANGNPSITLIRRPKKALFFINPTNGALETNETETSISYTWPGKDAYEAWRFS